MLTLLLCYHCYGSTHVIFARVIGVKLSGKRREGILVSIWLLGCRAVESEILVPSMMKLHIFLNC